MTIFDPSAVRRLEADTQSRPFVRTMLDTYLTMLERRVDRILGAVLASDPDEALDAALSLRVSSIMTGTVELAGLATEVADQLRAGDLPAARTRALLLPEAAGRARSALDDYLAETSGAAQASADSIR